jgi:hypothetical protein
MTSNISPYYRFALLLASGMTFEDAAQGAGLSEAAARRARKHPRILRKVRDLQAERRRGIVGLLSDAAREAVETLRDLQQEGTPASARLGAARAVLEFEARITETVALEERIARLELGRESQDAEELAEAY